MPWQSTFPGSGISPPRSLLGVAVAAALAARRPPPPPRPTRPPPAPPDYPRDLRAAIARVPQAAPTPRMLTGLDRAAWHEAGHAVAAHHLLAGVPRPVRLVYVGARAGGAATHYDAPASTGVPPLAVALAGAVAERLIGVPAAETGAASDLEAAAALAAQLPAGAALRAAALDEDTLRTRWGGVAALASMLLAAGAMRGDFIASTIDSAPRRILGEALDLALLAGRAGLEAEAALYRAAIAAGDLEVLALFAAGLGSYLRRLDARAAVPRRRRYQ